MKLLVTGATGFVGSQLIARWAGRDYQIKALVRDPHRCPELQRWPVEICQGDVNAPETLRPAVAGVDAIIHLASRVGEGGDREEFFRVNVEGTRNLFEACRGLPLRRFVHVSSLSVITGYREHEGTKEDAPYLPTGENYADSKIEAEKLALEYGRKAGLPVTVLRPGFIFGPGDKLFLPTVIQNLRNGKVLLIDGGHKLLNLTFVNNLLEAIDLALQRPEAVGEVFNITDGEKVSKRDFFFEVADLMHLPRPTKSVPFFAARALCSATSLLYRALRIRKVPPLSRMKLRFAGQNQWFDIGKAKSVLGYRPANSFKGAMRDSIRWYREHLEPGMAS